MVVIEGYTRSLDYNSHRIAAEWRNFRVWNIVVSFKVGP